MKLPCVSKVTIRTKKGRLKKKGDRLQKYDLCQNIYIYKTFMCNDPSTTKCLDKCMFPIHAMVMILIDTMEGKHH